MGAGASAAAAVAGDGSVLPEGSSTKGRSEHWNTENYEFRGNAGALRVIINTDGSRIALIKYLERLGISCYLDFFFEIDLVKQASVTDVIDRVNQVKEHYDPSKLGSVATKAHERVWKFIEENVKSRHPAIALEQLYVCQSRVEKVLIEILSEFMKSPEYAAWEHELSKLDSSTMSVSASVTNTSHYIVPSCAEKYPNVLLVDDSNVLLKLISKMLQKNGHEVTIASHGREALEMCAGRRFDIIVIDCFMPIMDGFEAVELFRSQEKRQNKSFNERTIVVGMSGDRSEPTVRRAKDAGIDFFLEKPFALKNLNKVMASADKQSR